MKTLSTAVALTALILPAAANAAPRALPPVQKQLTADKAVKRTCATTLRSGKARGIARTTYRAPMSGYVNVRLGGARGDWDLAVFDATSRRRMGSSQAFGSNELVQVWVTSGQRLAIQGCRRSRGRRAALEVQLIDVKPPKRLGTPSLVRVKLEDENDLHHLEELGLDVTHNVKEGTADLVLNTVADRKALKSTGLDFTTRIADFAAAYDDARAADLAYARRLSGKSNLPSGDRASYRELSDYENELKGLTEAYPGHVKPVTLPKKTVEGRTIGGVEIGADVKAPEDGRPVYFVVGVHHAREWPAGEAAMEFAHLLARGYGTDARITDLLRKVRVVIVPILNKDGFHASREAGKTYSPRDNCDRQTDYSSDCDWFETVEGVPTGGAAAYRRKNCRGHVFPVGTPCELQHGVDPNRNYGEGWGGIGASMQPFAQTYRGTGPWSEPETQAVHEYTQKRQVTNLITIHNVAALVLRPPGRKADGLAPDEPRLKELGDAMAAAAGYTSQYGWELYDTSGTTEDWNYAAAGTFGYTIEMGPEDGWFHMAYKTGVVDEWNGTGPREGKGLREALLISLESAANPSDHAVIEGSAPAGRVLRVRKEFTTFTSAVCRIALDEPFLDQCHAQGDPIAIPDFIESRMVVPESGAFQWHVTPSTRPFVGWRRDLGPTQSRRTDTYAFDLERDEPGAGHYDREFTVTEEDQTEIMMVNLTWPGNAEDYDLELYYKAADGTLKKVGAGVGGFLPNGTQVFNGGTTGGSGNPPGFAEAIRVREPAVGTYVARVVNFASTGATWELKVERLHKEPDVFTDLGTREAWTLTCEMPDGTVLSTQQVSVERGQRAALELGKGCQKPKKKGR